MMKLKRGFLLVSDFILCWDFLTSLFVASILYYLLPSTISNAFSRDVYGIGISVLSIVFSVYFAALAIIISSSDDDFVDFLEEQGSYTGIISTFRSSLFILFIALLFSLFIYALTSAWIASGVNPGQTGFQSKKYFVAFVFLFFYGLFCALNATLDSIKYALSRARYLKIKRYNNRIK